MKLLSRESDYAVKILISVLKKNEMISVTILEKELEMPRPFLRKIVQKLANADIIQSRKGRNGGFKLIKNAHEIRLIDIMEIFQGKFSMNHCLFKKHICPNKSNCNLRKAILDIEAKVEQELKSVTLSKIINS